MPNILAGDYVQALIGAYELSADSTRVTINDRYDTYDVSSFGSQVHKFTNGKRNISIDHSGFMEAAAARSHPVLKAGNLSGMVSFVLGANASPVVGDIAYSLPILQSKYGMSPAVGSVVPFNATFANQGDLGGWGVALAVPISFTVTSNGSAVNNGGASSNGASAFLHILQAAANDTYTIILEGSATGSFGGEQTTLGTFSANASALTSERLALAGSIPQYVRWKATRTGFAGNTVRIAITLIRH